MTQYERYRAKGLCGSCGKKLIGNRKEKSICASCQARNSKYIKENIMSNKKRIEYRRANRLCTDCGEPLTDKYTTCDKCRYKRKLAAQRFRDRRKYA